MTFLATLISLGILIIRFVLVGRDASIYELWPLLWVIGIAFLIDVSSALHKIANSIEEKKEKNGNQRS